MSSDAPPQSTSRRFRLRVLWPVLLAVLVFAGLSLASDVRALGQSLRTFNWPSFGVALLLVLGNYFFRFLRWQYYLRILDVTVPVRLSALVFLSGFAMSVTPGKMGEVFKSVLLKEYRGIRVPRTASIVVAERLLDLVALVALVSIGSRAFAHGRAVAVVGGMVVLAIVVACTARGLGHAVLDSIERLRLEVTASVVPKLRETYDALHALTRPWPFFLGGSLALLGWALECVATWWLLRGFDVPMSFSGATFGYAAGTLAGALAMLPGGLGVAEVGMSGLFRAAAPSLSLASATAATILVRLSTLWFGVALGGLSFLVLRATERKKSP